MDAVVAGVSGRMLTGSLYNSNGGWRAAARERRRKGPRTCKAAGAMIDAITADGNSIVVFGLPHRKGGSGGGRGGVSSAVHELDIL